MIGLVFAALLLGVTLLMATRLAHVPQPPQQREAGQEEGRAAGPELAAQPAPPIADSEAQAAEDSNPLAGVRIVDPSWGGNNSCKESAWPYVDQRCLGKFEPDSETDSKIGPRKIDSLAQSRVPEQNNGPIGSTTAIVPARPRVNAATDAAATREPDEENAETAAGGAVEARGLPELATPAARSLEPGKEKPGASDYQARQAARQTPTYRRRVTVTEQVETPKPRQKVDASEKKKPRRIAGVRNKADSKRPVRVVAARSPAPQFFFPFGWFVPTR